MVMPPPGGMPGMPPPGMNPGLDPMMGAQMAPPMLPPAPVMDPEALYQAAAAIQAAIEAQAEALLRPQYPPWYREEDYPQPEPAAYLEKAKQLQAEFSGYRTRVQDDLVAARMESSGIFKDDRDEPDLTPWKDTSIMGEVELQAYQLADARISFDAKAPTPSLEDEAGRKIDFALAALDAANRTHVRSGNGPLPLEKARTLLLTGRLAWTCQLNIDPDVGEMPFQEMLLDPTTVYPVFEPHRGLALVAHVYTTTMGYAVATFDDAEGSLREKFITSINRQRAVTQQNPRRREEEAVEVTQVVDRRWRAIYFDGVHATTTEHMYGVVPYVYLLGPLGAPGQMRDPEQSGAVRLSSGEYAEYHARNISSPAKGLGLPSLLKIPTRLREAFLTRMLTGFTRSLNPALGVAMDDIAYDLGTPEIDRSAGAVNPFKLGRHEMVDIGITPDPTTLAPLLQAVADNGARLSQPPTAHGLNDKSNVSGYATQGLNEAGRIKLVPWLRTLEEFERQCMEMRFRFYRDFGHLVRVAGSDDFGTIQIPRAEAGPDEPQMSDLTPGDLKRAGIQIEVSMASLPLQMLGPVANAIGILMQLGLEDEIGAMRLLNVQNPYKKLRRIQLGRITNDPIVVEAQLLDELARKGETALATFIAARKMQMKAADLMGMGAGPGGAPPGGGTPAAMGDSQAAMGRPPGPGSGPQGPVVNAPSDPTGTEL